MMHCRSCHVGYTGALDHCPLCGDALEGTPIPRVFPKSGLAKPRRIASRMLLIMTIAVLALVVCVGIIAGTNPFLIGIACLALLINYAFIRNIIEHSLSMLRMIERYYLVLMALALLCLIGTGESAVATFIIPVLSLIALISNGVLVVLFRETFVWGYAKYLLYDVALGIVPLALLALGLVSWPVLVIASACVAVLLLVLMLCLTRRQLASELRKLFSA